MLFIFPSVPFLYLGLWISESNSQATMGMDNSEDQHAFLLKGSFVKNEDIFY